jgi:hypothetical protein
MANHADSIFKGLAENQGNHLRFLDLSFNTIGVDFEGYQKLFGFKALEKLTSLHHLDMSYNSMSYEQCKLIGECLKKNTSIIGFHSEGNALVLDAWGCS